MLGLVLVVMGSTAHASGHLGVGVGTSIDPADRALGGHTRFGPGGLLQIPVAVDLGGLAALRIDGRAEVAPGSDRVTWTDGARRYRDDDHFALLAAASLVIGVELGFGEGAVQPYATVGAGPAWVGAYHGLSGTTAPLVDPRQNDVDDTANVDPYTNQAVLAVQAALGARLDAPAAPWAELGYGSAWVPEHPLRKSPNDLDARRSGFAWNPLRLVVGVGFPL